MTDLTTASVTPSDLSRIGVFRDLSPAELQCIFDKLDVQMLRPRAQVALDTEFSGRTLFVLQGHCRALALAPNGESVTILRLVSGDTFGLAVAISGHSFGFRVGRLVCDTSVTLLSMPHAEYRVLADNIPKLCAATANAVCGLHLELISRFYELATLDVRGRLVAELVRMRALCEQIGAKFVLRPAPTHAELGEQISAAREAVTRHLLELERDGILIVGRREIVIEDFERLQQLDETIAGRRQFLRDADRTEP